MWPLIFILVLAFGFILYKAAKPHISTEVELQKLKPKWKESKESKLLKNATHKKKAGDLEGAIRDLRAAYEIYDKGHIIPSVEVFLRLPSYLQLAGKKDEAWGEYNKLIAKVGNYWNDPHIAPMMCSKIYDKMRLFLQRENKYEKAVKFGVFSHVMWSTGLLKQKRRGELKELNTTVQIQKLADKLLKKTKTNCKDELVAIIEDSIKHLPNIHFGNLGKDIDKLIRKP